MNVIERLRAMRSELDGIILSLEATSTVGFPVVTHYTQLNVGSIVELLRDYTHESPEYSLPKGRYEVDYVEDAAYNGSLDVTFEDASVWYNFEDIRKQTQILLVR